jgi:GDP-L-fucose synthase
MKLISPTLKIAVFGCSGMAGSAICRALKRNGYYNLLLPKRKDLNLLNYGDVKEWFSKFQPDIVIIAAAKVGGIYANNKFPADFILENLKIQNNIIEISWVENVKKLLFLGSSCIYPKYAKQPIKEEELLQGSLESTNQWYAIAKISGIKLCEALRRQYGFNAISLMPTNLYGPGDNYDSHNSHVLASFIKRFCEAKYFSKKRVTCWGSGTPLREFLHVDDLGDATVFALENWDLENTSSPKDIDGNILPFLNVGTGCDMSIYDLALLIADFVGFEGDILWDSSKPDGTPRKLLDVSRLKDMGWTSKIKFEDGLKSTIRQFRSEIMI